MKYHKLVRDNIPEIIRQRGNNPIIHVADEIEYGKKLMEKLGEEVEEFRQDNSPEELADILEVIDAIVEYKHFDRAMIEQTKKKKAQERGGFLKKNNFGRSVIWALFLPKKLHMEIKDRTKIFVKDIKLKWKWFCQ